MRLTGSADGIYPNRLSELAKIKYQIDKISEKNGISHRFYFGSIVDFFQFYSNPNQKKQEQGNIGWIKLMSHIMNCIFTEKK